ncbi:MAG: hypothetical protein HUU31_22300 [Anaerolineae bacterium]|nr:hypothetical protein [Anaerolineae bacterium]
MRVSGARLRGRFDGLRLDPADAPAYFMIGVWSLIMVAVPILRWTVGEAVFPLDITAGVVAQAAAALLALRRWRRRRRPW